MHAVDICICGDHHIIIAQGVEAVLDIEGVLEEVELLILIDHLFGQAKAVERLSTKAEYSLGIDVARLGDRTTRGVALRDEKGRLQAHSAIFFIFFVAVVSAAVTQLFVVEVGGLGALGGELLDACYLFALTAQTAECASGVLGQYLDFYVKNHPTPFSQNPI